MTVAIIGWALVHSLWQGVAIAGVFAMLLLVTRASSPGPRYWAGLTALVAMIVLPVATAMRLVQSPSASQVTLSPAPAPDGAGPVVTESSSETPGGNAGSASAPSDARLTWKAMVPLIQDAAVRAMPWMVALWFIGLLLSSLRLLGGLARTRRMTREGVTAANAILEARVRALASQIDLTRAVKILESASESAPLVIGALRPVIVLPASLVTGLTPLQLDMLLVHELAHIRRNDFVINLAQTIIDTLLFYHPAARWVSKRVREERENCCDDVAIRICGGDAKAYAATLLALEEARPDSYHLAAAARGGSLLKRVRRLIPGQPAHRELGPVWIAGIVTIAAALFTGREAVALGIHSSLIPGNRIEVAADTTDKDGRRLDSSKAAPSSVIRAPSGGSLDERWRWAEQRGASLGSSYWIGYVVQGDPDATSFYYASDVPVSISNGSVQMSGSMRFMSDDAADMLFSGVRLGPLVGEHQRNSMLMLFQMSQGVTGRRIIRTHVSTFSIPAYFFGRPLIWLDRAMDAESIGKLQGLMRTATVDAQKNIVGAIGVHTSDNLVVPVLSSLAQSSSANEEVRQSAIESLGRESGTLALPVITRVARNDRSTDVRREAIHALAHLEYPPAIDSLISFVRNARTYEERRAAIEAISSSADEVRALAVLKGLAERDPDEDVRVAAMETMVGMKGTGTEYVESVIRGSGSSELRLRALEIYADHADRTRAVGLLRSVIVNDREQELRLRALDLLADQDDRGMTAVRELARTSTNPVIRDRAREIIADR